MPAVFDQYVFTRTQCRRQIETFNAPSRPAPLIAGAPEDDGRPVKLAQHPRGHDAHYADVPHHLPFDNDVVPFWIKPAAHISDGRFSNAPLCLLSLAVARIQFPRQRQGFRDGLRPHEIKCLRGVLHPPRRIQAWSQLITHFIDAYLSPRLADLFQGDESRSLRFPQSLQTMRDQHPVLPTQRHQIRHRAQGDQIQKLPDVIRGHRWQPQLPTALHQRMEQFKSQPGRTEHLA